MDKTYAEATGHAPFDWNLALNRTEQGLVTEQERYDMIVLALEWTTCACGNACAIIPRWPHGSPVDNDLADLGCIFYACVNTGSWKNAKNTLAEIEARSAVLIAEELRKRQSGD